MNEDDNDGKIWTIFWVDGKTGKFESEMALTYEWAKMLYHKKRGYQREMNIHSLKVFEGMDIM